MFNLNRKALCEALEPVSCGWLIALTLRFILCIGDAARGQGVMFGLASGMFALAGFVATARSFLLFKMNECVYEKTDYHRHVRDIEGQSTPIYSGLRVLDERMGRCLWACCLSTAFLWLAAMCSGHACQAASYLSDLALGMVLFTSLRFAQVSRSMSRNFNSIIDWWEDGASKRPAAPTR